MPAPAKPKPVLHIVQLLPNCLTVIALCAGLTAIRFSIQGEYWLSVGLIVLAALLDALDGRLARLLKSESAIGAELDSLGDFVNFGVTPALTLYWWGMQSAADVGWIAVLVYCTCCVLRLARFNVSAREPAAIALKDQFTGVPAPAGALLVMLPIYVGYQFPNLPHMPAWAVAIYMGLVGALMISRISTPSLKSVHIYAENARFLVVGFVALVAAIVTYPWITLAVLDLGYMIYVIYDWRHRHLQKTSGDL